MATDASLLIPPSLQLAALLLGDDGVTIRAISEATDVCRLVCGEPAERVHSRYTRTLGDLPWARFVIHLHVEVRWFLCEHPTCPGARPEAWLDAAAASGIEALKRFAAKLLADQDAAQARLTLRHSNGQTEGQVTKLKLVKRQGYGRAKVDPLRKRLLRAV